MGRNGELSAFFNGPKLWVDGLGLYLKYGKNEGLKQIFIQTGQTEYNHARLLEELRLLGAVRPTPPLGGHRAASTRGPASTVDPAVDPAVDSGPTASSPTLPADDPRILILYRERQQLHAQLMVLPTDEERRASAFRILEITEQLDHLLSRPKPLGPSPKPQNPMRQLLNNRAYISKNRHRQDKIQEVTRRMQENEQLEYLLKKAQDE